MIRLQTKITKRGKSLQLYNLPIRCSQIDNIFKIKHCLEECGSLVDWLIFGKDLSIGKKKHDRFEMYTAINRDGWSIKDRVKEINLILEELEK